jgi:hypothetical protein
VSSPFLEYILRYFFGFPAEPVNGFLSFFAWNLSQPQAYPTYLGGLVPPRGGWKKDRRAKSHRVDVITVGFQTPACAPYCSSKTNMGGPGGR